MRDWLRRNVPGKSFADIGCMWGIDGELSFFAEELGATRVTGFDGLAPTEAFLEEHRRRDSSVRFVQGDFHDPVSVEEIGEHDIVLCNGVVYHSPNPYLLIHHLRRITGELLLLGSHTVPEVPGFEQACFFYPGLGDRARAAFATPHAAHHMPALNAPFNDRRYEAYDNMWWGITPSALAAMPWAASFEPVEFIETRERPFFTHLVAKIADRPPSLPPPEENGEVYARARAEGIVPPLPGS